jgi:hypothetical protein
LVNELVEGVDGVAGRDDRVEGRAREVELATRSNNGFTVRHATGL